MKRLWAPWRMSYIRKDEEGGCIFCDKPMEGKDAKNLILYRGRHAFVMMNKFPYNNGHVMVVPKRHCVRLEQLTHQESVELFELMSTSIKGLRASLHPDGFNIGMNIGKAGGAGEKHIHVHIVPRWTGDTNFMAIFGEARIIPEYLDETYEKLLEAFAGQSGKECG